MKRKVSKVERNRNSAKGGRPKGKRKTGGRRKGTPNKVTVEIRAAAQAFLSDAKGQAKLLAAFRAGKLNPALVVMFHHYAYGKPRESIDVNLRATAQLQIIEEITDAKDGRPAGSADDHPQDRPAAPGPA